MVLLVPCGTECKLFQFFAILALVHSVHIVGARIEY